MRQVILHILILSVILILFPSCSNNSEPPVEGEPLELISKFQINVPEPSDLTFSADKKNLWTVSDSTNSVYLISFSGLVKKEIDSHAKDVEGITMVTEGRLAVVQEEKAEVVIIDTAGNKMNSSDIDLNKSYNTGLEGITYNKNTNRYYCVNEKDPMVLLTLDDRFKVVSEKELNISTDLSAVFYEENENVYWVVSDESKLLAKFDSALNLIKTYKLPVEQAEGAAIDFAQKLVYIVSDAENALYVFKLNK